MELINIIQYEHTFSLLGVRFLLEAGVVVLSKIFSSLVVFEVGFSTGVAS